MALRGNGSIDYLNQVLRPMSQPVCYSAIMEKHLTYWWISQLKTDHSGIAWYGKNTVSEGVGLSWCALNNPSPATKIKSITFEAPESDGIYTLFALTLADRQHYVPVKPTSFGGPDNWAAATTMAAFVEGLAGITNSPDARTYSSAIVSPKWATTPTDSISICIRYAASNAYTAYNYYHHKAKKQIDLYITGGGKKNKSASVITRWRYAGGYCYKRRQTGII